MGTDLPSFDGDAFTWLKFVKKYLKTSGEMCGFTPSEDMDRIRKALRHPANTLVSGYLENPDNLDRVMDSLHNNYGQPWILIEAAYNKAQKMNQLREDLSNLAVFCGEVDQLRVVVNMDPENPLGLALVKTVERKLSDDYAEKWLDIRGLNNVGSIDLMANFLLERQARRINLRRGQVEKGQRTKPVLALQGAEPAIRAGPEHNAHTNHREEPNAETQPLHPQGDRVCKLKCHADHPMSICPRFRDLSVKSRWYKIRQYKLCAHCLQRHPKDQCKSEAKCTICQLNHHPLLHPLA